MGVKILGPIKLKYLFIFTMKICKENILLIIKHICYLKYDFALFLFRFLHFIVSIFQSNLKRIPFGSHHVTFFSSCPHVKWPKCTFTKDQKEVSMLQILGKYLTVAIAYLIFNKNVYIIQNIFPCTSWGYHGRPRLPQVTCGLPQKPSWCTTAHITIWSSK